MVTLVELVGCGVPERIGEPGGPVLTLVSEGTVEESAGTLVGDTTSVAVIEIAVPFAISGR